MNRLKFKCLLFVKIQRFEIFIATLAEYQAFMVSAPSSLLFKEKLNFLSEIKDGGSLLRWIVSGRILQQGQVYTREW